MAKDNGMETMNLWDIFGIDIENVPTKKEEKKPKKKETAKTSKKDESSKGKTPEKKNSAKDYHLPLTIYAGTKKLTMAAADGGSLTVKEEDIAKYVSAQYSYFAKDCIGISKENNGVVIMDFYDNGQDKGALTGIKTDGKPVNVLYGSQTMPMDVPAMDEAEKEGRNHILVEDLRKELEQEYPYLASPEIRTHCYVNGESGAVSVVPAGNFVVPYSSVKEEKDLIPFPEGVNPESAIEIMAEDGVIYGVPKSAFEGKEDIPTVNYVAEHLGEMVPELAGNDTVKLLPAAGSGTYLAVPACGLKKASASGSGNDQTYPVDGVVLSLLFQSYVLSTDDFGGKEEVTAKELIAYLVDKGHREYAFAKPDFIYSKQQNIILATIKGSKKGAVSEMESRKASFFCDETLFFWYYLAYRIYHLYGKCEVLAEMYYQEDTGKILWYVPKQMIGRSTIDAYLEPCLQSFDVCGLKKIGQFHSHGHYPAFFSSTDDADEQLPGLYGVIGSIQKLDSYAEEEGEMTLALRTVRADGTKESEDTCCLRMSPCLVSHFAGLVKENTASEEILRFLPDIHQVEAYCHHNVSFGRQEDEPYPLDDLDGTPILRIWNPAQAYFLSHCKNIFVYCEKEDGNGFCRVVNGNLHFSGEDICRAFLSADDLGEVVDYPSLPMDQWYRGERTASVTELVLNCIQ